MSEGSITLTPLPWDSRFFGFGVGWLEGPLTSEAALRQVLNEASRTNMQLIYAQCTPGDAEAQAACRAAGGRFVDAKRTYSRPLHEGLPEVHGLVPADCHPCSRRQLRSLAWQSAEYSRFRVDPQMPAGTWRRLFSVWIAKSLNGELADAVLVERDGAQIRGMITVKCSGEKGSVGLFAVDTRWRGRGIGRQLLAAAAAHCSTAGCRRLDVVTQGQNHAACRAYEAASFELSQEQHVFHFWLGRT